MSDWREQYKPGDWVEMRLEPVLDNTDEWVCGQVSVLDGDRHGPFVGVDVDGLVLTVRASENIRAAKPPRPAKKRLRVKAGA